MQNLRLNLTSGNNLNLKMNSGSSLKLQLKEASGGTKNYNDLVDKPSINNVVLVGNKTLEDLGVPEILYNTTEYWNSQIGVQSKAGVLYVYSDYKEEDGVYIPGVKIGDGNAYIIDLPFTDEIYAKHVLNKAIHVTDEERAFWNNKVTCFVDPLNENKVIFTKE